MTVTDSPRLHQDWINPHAYGIVKALQKHGHTTYLVGGCVRDLLLGIHPKDFDIVTTARPEQVQKVVYRAYLIGRRFKLVLVRRDEAQFEVATFRRVMTIDEAEEGDVEADNLFGTPKEDAQRRDFTINAMFYDPVGKELIDYGQGKEDLENRVVRMIGEPNLRLQEDPIRILRALRLKHMINFSLDADLREAIRAQASTLATTVLPRRREEILKFLRLPDPSKPFLECMDLNVLEFILPTLHRKLTSEPERSELFFELLQNRLGHYQVGSMSEPGELFAFLVHCYLRAFIQPDPGHVRSKDILENEEIGAWMRDELGMFKSEMALVAKAIHFEGVLDRIEDFNRKGERRQLAMVAHEAFPLAVAFAYKDLRLDSGGLCYWRDKLVWAEEMKLSDPSLTRAPANKRRRTRPRRRKPSGEGGGRSGDDNVANDENQRRV